MHRQDKQMPKSPGRPKGKGNKTTESVRAIIGKMAEMNAPKLNRWLQEVYEQEGPGKAIDCFSKLVEYHIPKQRQIDLVTTHIDVAAILDRAKGRVLDVTPAPAVIEAMSESEYQQVVTARVSAELGQAYADPAEFEPEE